MTRSNNREKLLERGRQLVHSTSFSVASVQNITDAAGVPKGSFYNHFKDKDTFGVAIIGEYDAIMQQELLASLVDSELGPLERLCAMFKRWAEGFQSDGVQGGCLAGNLCQELASRNENFRVAIDSAFRGWEEHFRTCVSEGQARGEIRDDVSAGELAQLILYSWEGALLRSKAARNIGPLLVFQSVFLQLVKP